MSNTRYSHFTRHELEKRSIIAKTLHEKMMIEAEPIIRYNWTDVAIHDKNKLRQIPVGHYCAWIVGEMGSYLTPLFCKISDRHKWCADGPATIAPVQVLVVRWHNQVNEFGESPAWVERHDPTRDKRCFLVVKTDLNGNGEITPISYVELAEMATCGKMRILKG